MNHDRKLVRARALAIGSFVPAALFQTYAVYARQAPPDNAAYAPHPYFLVAFFAIQVALQSYWIMQLFRHKPREPTLPLLERDDAFRDDMLHTRPVNPTPETAQVAYVRMNRRNAATHLVAKTNAGISVLYLWTAWGALQIGASRPAIQQQVHCGVLSLLLVFASGPDPTLGICLLLDLAALVAGKTKEEWRFAFFCIAGVLFVVIVSDSMLAWKNRHTLQTYAHSRLDVDETGFRDSDQIWLSNRSQDSSDPV
ncbi:hypothetical protein B0H11DRAFT_2242653 [Mycena galericulata]|nr:hypothetical protein B0H11DRAFT_2242653 [Mycena galericulata]